MIRQIKVVMCNCVQSYFITRGKKFVGDFNAHCLPILHDSTDFAHTIHALATSDTEINAGSDPV